MPRPRRPPHEEDVGVAVAGVVVPCACGVPLDDVGGVVELRAGHPIPRFRRPEQSDDVVVGGSLVVVGVDVGPVGSPNPPPPPPPSRPPPEPPPSKPPPPPLPPPLGV